MIDEINQILSDLYKSLAEMTLQERIDFLKSWGLNVYSIDKEINEKENEIALLPNYSELLHALSTSTHWASLSYFKHEIIKIEIMRVMKRQSLGVINSKPMSKYYFKDRYYSINHYSHRPVEMKDLIITFRVIYSDETFKIRTINGDSEECKKYLSFMVEHN